MTDKEVRLTYGAKTGTRMPIYFQYDPGNVLDKNSLMGILAQLKALRVSTSEVLEDAGYCTLANLSGCIEAGLDIVGRIPSNYCLHKDAVAMVEDCLDQPQNAVRYGNRILHVCKVETTHEGHPVYLYVALDKQEQASQARRLQKSVEGMAMDPRELSKKIRSLGRFVMLSTRDLPISEVVPYYYKRQEIEQMLDVCKNYAKILPLRVHSEETLRGHLMVTFIATALLSVLQTKLDGKSIESESAKPVAGRKASRAEPKRPGFRCIDMLNTLNNRKCIVFPAKVIPCFPTRGPTIFIASST